MALPLGVSWLCTLLWGCICFPAQKGYHIAHGYYLYEYPQSYGQLHSGVPLKTNHENEIVALRHQNFASLQRQSRENVYPATRFRKETAQTWPDSGHGANEYSVASSTPSPQKHEQSSSDKHHPFGLLMRKHTKDPGKGVSFPTINHVEQFIKSMKNSFFTPGLDSRRYFQTARETMKNVGESSVSHGSDSGKGDTASRDNSKKEVWRRPSAKYQMPGKLMKSNLPVRVLPGENNEIFKSAVENQRPELTRYKQRKQKLFPAKPFYRKDSASPVNRPRSPAQEFSYYSGLLSKLPTSASEQKIPEHKYKSHSRDSGYKTPSGFHRVTHANFFHPKKPPNLNFYNKGLYAPRGQHYSTDLLPKHRDINYVPTVYQPASTGSLFSSYNNLFPQRRSGHVGIQTNSPHEPYNQMDRSHLAFPMKPSRSPHGSRGLNNYVGYHKVYNQNLIPAIHRPNDRTIITPHGIDSTPSGTAAHRVRTSLGSFSLPHRRGLSPNHGFVSAVRAGLLKTFVQPTNVKILQSALNNPSRNLGHLPSQQLSGPTSSLKNCAKWGNKKGPPPQKAQTGLQSYADPYMKSKNRFARATTYQSNICYVPYEDTTGMTAKLYRNML